MPNIILRQIRAIPSAEGQAAANFLSGHPNMPLFVSSADTDRAKRMSRKPIPSDVYMAYLVEDKSFYINHKLFHTGGTDEEKFIKSQAAQKEFAAAVSSTFVHETSHARVSEGQYGAPLTVEQELLAFYREYIFVLDALKAFPDFDRLMECLPIAKKGNPLQRRRTALLDITDKKKLRLAQPEIRKIERQMKALAKTSAAATPSRLDTLFDLELLALSNSLFEAEVRRLYAELPDINADPDRQSRNIKKKIDAFLANYHKVVRSKDQWEPGTFPKDFDPNARRLSAYGKKRRLLGIIRKSSARTGTTFTRY